MHVEEVWTCVSLAVCVGWSESKMFAMGQSSMCPRASVLYNNSVACTKPIFIDTKLCDDLLSRMHCRNVCKPLFP